MNPGPTGTVAGLGHLLTENKLAQGGELLVVCTVPIGILFALEPLAGESLLAQQGVVSAAILIAILLIWLGLRLRGQNWSHFGLTFARPTGRRLIQVILQSFVVLVGALASFMVGAVVMVNIVGMPEGADMSGYTFLHGNLPMLFFMLASVYVTASFGEEFIYRGFLINRIAELGSGSKAAWRFAVVISAIVFGLIHFHWGPAGMVQTGFMGLALGVSYLLVQRNLWVTILAHGYMDTVLMVQLYRAVSA